MELSNQFIQNDEKDELRLLLSDYLEELDVSIDYPYFDLYWMDNTRFPIKLISKELWIGFAFINRITMNKFNTISVAEFYIKPEYRHKGNGKEFIKLIFNLFDEKENWEICYSNTNIAAKKFWNKIYSEYTNLENKIDLIVK